MSTELLYKYNTSSMLVLKSGHGVDMLSLFFLYGQKNDLIVRTLLLFLIHPL